MSKLEGPLIAVYKRSVLAGFSFRFSLLFFSIGRTSALPDISDEYGGFCGSCMVLERYRSTPLDSQ